MSLLITLKYFRLSKESKFSVIGILNKSNEAIKEKFCEKYKLNI